MSFCRLFAYFSTNPVMKKQIPNLLTLGNLFCGSIAVIAIFERNLQLVPLLIGIAAILDFFDGFVARALKVSGPLGKELDSLADMVSFGLVPGLLMYHYLNISELSDYKYLGLVITLASCYRLANFNISTEQSEEFIGVPTPAATLYFLSYPLLEYFQSDSQILALLMKPAVVVLNSLLFAFLLNSKLRLLALKFKGFSLNKENAFRYSLILGALILIPIFKWEALPIAILYYILLSLIKSVLIKKSLS